MRLSFKFLCQISQTRFIPFDSIKTKAFYTAIWWHVQLVLAQRDRPLQLCCAPGFFSFYVIPVTIDVWSRIWVKIANCILTKCILYQIYSLLSHVLYFEPWFIDIVHLGRIFMFNNGNMENVAMLNLLNALR